MKRFYTDVRALIFFAGVFILFDSCQKKTEEDKVEAPPVINPTVNPIPYSVLVYLVTPTDKTIDYHYYIAARATMQTVQAWYKTKMGNNKTFVLNPVVVDTLTGLHESTWFLSNHGPEVSGTDHFQFNNVKYELKHLLGAKFDTTLFTYFVYVPATIGDETTPSGLAAEGLSNLDGLVSGSSFYTGMSTHSLGHAFGLPELAPQSADGIMCGMGISNYPNSTFTQVEKDSLNASPFLKVQ
jgi:hypothetical protein